MPPRTPRLPGAGDVIAAKYRLERLLKQGGMGAVWIATHLGLDERVALKFMDPRRVSSTEARIRFTREAKAAAQIRSKNIVQILDHGVDAGVPYIAMELLAGEDLGVRLRRAGRLSIGEASTLLDDIGHALDRAHAAGIVHRDLKPENIFLAKDGDHEIPKILDFGIALEVQEDASDDSAMTQEGVILGTPYFMSPEQVRGRTNIDHRSDLWSMGVILFRAITGIRPFGRGAPADVIVQICSDPIPRASVVARDLPDEVDRFFEKALARDVAKRFSSAKEMAVAFAEIARIAETADKTQQDLVIALGDRRSSRTQRKGPPPLPPAHNASKTLPSPSTDPEIDLATQSMSQPVEAITAPPGDANEPTGAPVALDLSPERTGLPPVVSTPSSSSEPTHRRTWAEATAPHDAPAISPATPAPAAHATSAISSPHATTDAAHATTDAAHATTDAPHGTTDAPPVIALPAATSSPPDTRPPTSAGSVAPSRGQDSRSGVWIALALLLIAAVVGVGFRDKLFPPPASNPRDPAGATTIVLTAGTVVLVGPAGVRAPAPTTSADAPSTTAAASTTATASAPPTATASGSEPTVAVSASASASASAGASATTSAKPPLTGTLKPPSTTNSADDPKPAPEPTKPPVSSPPKPDPRDLGY